MGKHRTPPLNPPPPPRSRMPLWLTLLALSGFLGLFYLLDPFLLAPLFMDLSTATWPVVFRLLGFLAVCFLVLNMALQVYDTLTALFHRQKVRNLKTDYWKALEKRLITAEPDTDKPAWGGFRKFRVKKKEAEAARVFSFYLVPHDQKALPRFLPGQYLTFRMTLPGNPRPLVRCYSLSDCPGKEHLRITVKKIPAGSGNPDSLPGAVSNFLGDRVGEGDILDVKAPAGQFYLDMEDTAPVVMVAGGVGVTPLVSMLNAALASGWDREIHFFYGVRDSRDHILKAHLESIAENHAHIHLHVCYSRPLDSDIQGRDYHSRGRVEVALIKPLLPASNCRFYVCGPPPMMASVIPDLKAWGVPEGHIHFESFGPASMGKIKAPEGDGAPLEILFKRSGKTAAWTPEAGTLLDLAGQHDIFIDSGCRTGNCGTCLTAVRSGTFDYLTPPGVAPEEGSCLTCIATPQTGMELDA